MKKLLPMLLLFLVPAVSFAQGSRVDDIAFKNLVTGIAPANGATVTVCTSAGTGIPCTPLATIYSDIALTLPQTNPITADSNGYYGFFAAAGTYIVTITGAGTSGRSVTYTLPFTLSGNNAFTGANTHSGTETFTGPMVVNTFEGNPIVGGATYPCTAVGINAAITALPTAGGVVDARGCQASITAQTTTVTVGSATQQVRLLLPAVTYSGSANPLFVVDRASILDIPCGATIQQTANAANGVILAGVGPQWVNGGIDGCGTILGPGQASSTGAGVIYGGGSQPGNATGNAANRTHMGPIRIQAFKYGIQFGNNVWSIDIKAFIGDSGAFTNSNNVGVVMPAGIVGTGESMVFSAPANISGNINQGFDIEIASSLWLYGVSIDSNGLGTANPAVTLNGVNSLFFCAPCWFEDVTSAAQTHKFIVGNNNLVMLMGGIMQMDNTTPATTSYITMAGAGNVFIEGTIFSQPLSTATNILVLSGAATAEFRPASISTGFTLPISNTGTGFTTGYNVPPFSANILHFNDVTGAPCTGEAAGDGCYGRGASSGAVFLGTDGGGYIFRSGNGAISIANGIGTLNTPPGGTASFPNNTGTVAELNAVQTWTAAQTHTGAAIIPDQAFGITGTTTNNNANAGAVGEYVQSVLATGSSVTLATGVTSNVTSISLTAGDWDVTGAVDFTFGATTSYTNLIGSISTTTGTIGGQDSKFDFETPAAVPTAGADATFSVPVVRFSLSGPTTVFLVAQGTFTVSTLKAYGTIRARRIR